MTFDDQVRRYADLVGAPVSEIYSAILNPRTSEDCMVQMDFNSFTGEDINNSLIGS